MAEVIAVAGLNHALTVNGPKERHRAVVELRVEAEADVYHTLVLSLTRFSQKIFGQRVLRGLVSM